MCLLQWRADGIRVPLPVPKRGLLDVCAARAASIATARAILRCLHPSEPGWAHSGVDVFRLIELRNRLLTALDG